MATTLTNMHILTIIGALCALAFLTLIIPNWTHFMVRLAFLLGIVLISSKHLLSGLLVGVVFMMYLKYEMSVPFPRFTEGMTNQTPKKQDDETLSNGKGPLDLELLKEQFRPKSSKMFPSTPHGGIPKTKPKPVETFENNYL